MKKLTDRRIIPHVLFELTNKCNLQCIHCYVVDEKRKELTTQEVIDVLRQCKELGVMFMTFTGGEILTRKDFFKIALEAKMLNFVLRLKTNGTLIDAEAADRIKQLNPICVDLSIYGKDAETYQKMTGHGDSYKKLMKAVDLLKERKISMVVGFPLIKQTESQYIYLKKVFRNRRIRFRPYFQITPASDGSREPLRCLLDRESLKRHMKIDKNHIFQSKNRDTELCYAGIKSITISAYGEVFPCVDLRVSQGNVLEQPLKVILQNSKAIYIRKSMESLKLKYCLACELSKYCIICPAYAVNIDSKQLRNKETIMCKMASVRKEIIERGGQD
ncbi:MAG: radical SAM protein [archaeon]